MTELNITPGCIVLIAGFDDIPEHSFRVEEVFDVNRRVKRDQVAA